MNTIKFTYVSLFSSTGVGCYGFKEEGYTCVATAELLAQRLKIQKINNKCEKESGYICGDLTNVEVSEKIMKEVNTYCDENKCRIDVVMATPPCQGMSVANQKKKDTEIVRNSLVVKAVELVSEIKPKVFIFENVAAFLKTVCVSNGVTMNIKDMIHKELGDFYDIKAEVLNLKNYGCNSSRTRTIVVGVDKTLGIDVSLLFPAYREEKSLRDVIGNMPKLQWGEICDTDFYHSFRVYKPEMRDWVHDLKEGQSAFDNVNPLNRPHKVVDGVIVENKKKAGDKYKRQYWDKVAPCVHTRMDTFSSQNTVHPSEDRVFSIRELMMLMSIPKSFKWLDYSIEELNSFTYDEKVKLLKKEELTIRKGIGEAVPTGVILEIAETIKRNLTECCN